MLYANAARSYKSGGFNAISPGSEALNPDLGGDPSLASFVPETINSLEVGIRTRLLDNTLQANLTAGLCAQPTLDVCSQSRLAGYRVGRLRDLRPR